VLDRTNGEGLLTNIREVPKEGLDVILRLVRTNSVYNIDLLISLLLPKNTNIIRLKEVSLVRRELNYPDLIHLNLKKEVLRVVASSSVY
jgi:hypothetical protein